MSSKLMMCLLTISLMLSSNVFAQAKKADSKKAKAAAAKEADAKKKEEQAKLDAAKKAEEEKALEEKRLAEAKAAAEKADAKVEPGALGYLKSHFSASYHGEYYFVRKDITSANEEDHKIQDLKIMHNPTVTYRPIKNYKVLVTSEFKYTDAEAKGTYINRHYRSLIYLTRENVLTEAENGIKMDVSIGRRIFDRNHGLASSYGNSRVNTSLSKKFGDKLSTSLLAMYLGNDPAKGKIKNTTYKHALELIPSFTYQITDKLSYFFNDDFVLNKSWYNDNYSDWDFSHEMNVGYVTYQFNDKQNVYFQFKYLRVSAAPFQRAPGTDDWFEYYIGYGHSFTPKLTLTPEVGSKIFGAHDGRDFFAKEAKYPEFALYLDYTL